MIKTLFREEDDLDNLVDGEMDVEEDERSRKESSKSNSSASSSDSNVSIHCSAIRMVTPPVRLKQKFLAQQCNVINQ